MAPPFAARLNQRLLIFAWANLFVAVVSAVAWFVIVASRMSGTPLDAVVRGGVLGIVLTQTHFGLDWMIRAGLAVAMAAALVFLARARNHVAGWAGLLASAAFVASLAWAGHGAVADDVPFDALHAPADILHLLAAGAWLGALIPLGMLLELAWRDASPAAVACARTATRRFSVIGLTCVGTLIVTGIVNTWFLAGNVPALLGTLYGQLLLLKVAIFGVIIAVASVNQRRLLPALADRAFDSSRFVDAIRSVSRNAWSEAVLGVAVLALVGIIGILPPGAHTEPHWPLPFRFDLGEVPPRAQSVLAIAALGFALCLLAMLFVAQRRKYRMLAAAVVALVLFGDLGWSAMRPGIVEAYPTSFYASTQAYATPSIARGAPLYVQNCAACHGADGRGDGPLAGTLPIRPANLTEPHLFAHKVGELYWWVSHGKGGVMPGFSEKLSSAQRWDLINYVFARTAGDLTQHTGPQISTTAAVPLPDFAFEQNGAQNTLGQTLKSGPVLVALFANGIPRARLKQLASMRPGIAGGLHVIAVELTSPRTSGSPTTSDPPLVAVSQNVRTALALFRSQADGGVTELMLDRGGNIRARWTAHGLATTATLVADAQRVATIPVAAANHAGHGG